MERRVGLTPSDDGQAYPEAGQPDAGAVQPIPPRYWWLKRIGLAVALLLLALGGLRWWWGCYAERQLQGRLDALRAAGAPVSVDELRAPRVADEQNAARYLQRAAALLGSGVRASPSLEFGNALSTATPDAAELRRLQRQLLDNRWSLMLVQQASERTRADWGMTYASPLINTMLPDLGSQRELTKFLADCVVLAHGVGDDRTAVARIGNILDIGEFIGQSHAFMIGGMVRIAIDALACGAIGRVAPGLNVGQGAGAVPRADVERLIARLLDETSFRDSWRRAAWSERVSTLDTLTFLRDNPAAALGLPGRRIFPMFKLLRPMLTLDVCFALRHMDGIAKAGLAPNYPAAAALMPPEMEFESTADRLVHLASSIVMPSLGRAVQLHFRALAERRMAATSLAIRLYQLDHDRRPAALAQLVPAYLPQVPADPFAADGRALGYRPDAERPRLYSVNLDGVDDGGEYSVNANGVLQGDWLDWVFALDGLTPTEWWRATTQPASGEAVDGQGDIESEQRRADDANDGD